MIATLLALALVAPAGANDAAARKPPLTLQQKCVTVAERRGIVRFNAAVDGTRLIGVLFGTGPRGVVLAHQGGGGAPGNLCSWVPYARRLAARGYRVLVFDHRTFGSSDFPRRPADYRRVNRDVVAAVAVIRKRGAKTVVLGGASLGGPASLVAATQIVPPVQGVMTFGSPSWFTPVDGLAAVKKLTLPLLFVAAEDDTPYDDDAREMYAAARSPDKRVEVFPGFEHGAPLLARPEVREVVDAWVDARSSG